MDLVNIDDKVNFKYTENEESKIRQLETLYQYSSEELDKYINPYLMNDGILKFKGYYNEETFRKRKYNEPTNNIKDIINSKIKLIDDYFKNHANKTEEEKIVYRGMETPYENDTVIGNTNCIKSFTSTSSDKGEAWNYSNNGIFGVSEGNECCIYEFKIAKGIPYIDMNDLGKYSSKYGDHKEILLPRNLSITYTGTADYKVLGKPVKKMNVTYNIPSVDGKKKKRRSKRRSKKRSKRRSKKRSKKRIYY